MAVPLLQSCSSSSFALAISVCSPCCHRVVSMTGVQPSRAKMSRGYFAAREHKIPALILVTSGECCFIGSMI